MVARRIIGFGLLAILMGCTAVKTTAVPLPTPTTNPLFAEGGATATLVPLPTIPPLITPETGAEKAEATAVIPILLYHHIGSPAEDDDKYLSISTDAFRDQMGFLARNGYQTLTLDDLTRILTRQQEPPPNPIIITFDDGYRDQYENAVPVLQEHGFTATFFITTEFIETGLDEFMTWDMLKELAQVGMRIESQSSSDVPLAGLDQAAIMAEVRGAQAALTAQIGESPRFLAYPFGAYDEIVVDTLMSVGLAGALTTSGSKTHSFDQRYEWGRIPVAGDWTLSAFAEQVRPAAIVDEPDLELGTAVITIYDDELHPNWTAQAAADMELSLESVSNVHEGIYALSVGPLLDDGEPSFQGRPETTSLQDSPLFFQVQPETTEWYRREQVVGVSFWLYSGMNEIAPGAFNLVVTGSNIQPYWAENDTSVGDSNDILTFSGTLAYSLGLERPVPRATWVRVDVPFDTLVFDPDRDDALIDEPEYEYVTGFYLMSDDEELRTIFIDEVELIMLSERP